MWGYQLEVGFVLGVDGFDNVYMRFPQLHGQEFSDVFLQEILPKWTFLSGVCVSSSVIFYQTGKVSYYSSSFNPMFFIFFNERSLSTIFSKHLYHKILHCTSSGRRFLSQVYVDLIFIKEEKVSYWNVQELLWPASRES